MKTQAIFSTLALLLLVCSCNNSTQGVSVVSNVDAGPVSIGVSVDANGKVSVSGGFAPKARIGLGPVGLSVGIQKTVELTSQQRYHMFILWEDTNGQVQCDEYEIGKKFLITFSNKDRVREIRGYNDSLIVVVERQSAGRERQPVVASPTIAPVKRTPTISKPPASEWSSATSPGQKLIADYCRLIYGPEAGSGTMSIFPNNSREWIWSCHYPTGETSVDFNHFCRTLYPDHPNAVNSGDLTLGWKCQ